MLLEHPILPPVASIRDRVRKVLRAVDLYRHSRVRAQKIHFKAPDTIEGNWQLGVNPEPALGFRQSFQTPIEKRLSCTSRAVRTIGVRRCRTSGLNEQAGKGH